MGCFYVWLICVNVILRVKQNEASFYKFEYLIYC